MSCPQETTVALFLDRRLAGARARELEGHVDDCASCRALLGALARAAAPADPGCAAGTDTDAANRETPDARPAAPDRAPGRGTSPPALDAGDDLVAGERLDRYVLLRVIGRGAMGTVFAAYDPALDRKVAVKLLRRDAASGDARARLVREAQALARVSSPNVVAVHDVGLVGDRIYLAMELVPGGTLRTWRADRPRSWRDVVRVFEAAGAGLAAAHAGGIIHRDFKPDNVLVDGERVYVADFGLAAASEPGAGPAPDTGLPAATDEDRALARSLTQTGAVVGTPSYMAPELFAGAAASARSDQFSYCVAFYEALFGRRPFTGATLDELLAAMRRGAPPRAGRAAGVPSSIAAIVERGLAPDPARRHPSMQALLDELGRARRRARRGWFAAGALAITGVSATAAVAIAGRATDPCADAGELPTLTYDRAALRAGFAAHARDGLAAATGEQVIIELARWQGAAAALRHASCRAVRVEAREAPAVRELRLDCVDRSVARVQALAHELTAPSAALVDDALPAVRRAADLTPCAARRELLAPQAQSWPPADPAQRAAADALRQQLAEAAAANAAGRHDDAARVAAQIAARAEALSARALAADAWDLAAVANARREQFLAARDAYERALAAAEAAHDDLHRFDLLIRMVRLDQELARPDDGLRRAAAARSVYERLEDPTLRWRLAWAEGAALIQKEPARSVALLREAIALHDAAVPTIDRDSIALVRGLGAAQVAAGEVLAGRTTLQRALELGAQHLGPRHPELIDPLLGIAMSWAAVASPDKALPYLERAFDLAEAAAGREHERLPRAAVMLAGIYAQQMRVRDAIAVADRAVAAGRDAYGESETFSTLYAIRAEMLALDALEADLTPARRKERLAGALRDRLLALAIQRRHLPADSPELATALDRLGRIQRFADQPADAVRSFEEALAIRARDPSPSPRDALEAELGLGGALTELGRPADGLAHAERALAIAAQPSLLAGASDLADAKATVAAALVALRRDRARALQLLRDARATYVEIEEPTEIAEVDRHLARLGAR